jgi:hypothetical protein
MLTCTNCGEIGHSLETSHNRKKKVPIVLIATIKFIELVAEAKTQLVKLGKIHVHYPCIICFNVEHRLGKCPKKIEVQNMFRIKPINFNAAIVFKPPKTDNMPVNVVVVVTTHNQ